MKKFPAVVLCMLLLFSACAEGMSVKVTGSVLNTPVDAAVMLGTDEDGCRQLIAQTAAIGKMLLQLEESGVTFAGTNGEAVSISREALSDGLFRYLMSELPEEAQAKKILSMYSYATGNAIVSDAKALETLISSAMNRFAAAALNLGLVHFYENGDLFISGTNDETEKLLSDFLSSCRSDREMLQTLSGLQIFSALGLDGNAAANSIFSALGESFETIFAPFRDGANAFGEFSLFVSREGSISGEFYLSGGRNTISAVMNADANAAEFVFERKILSNRSTLTLSADERGLFVIADDGYMKTEIAVTESEIAYESHASGGYEQKDLLVEFSAEELIYERHRLYDGNGIHEELLICPKDNTYSYSIITDYEPYNGIQAKYCDGLIDFRYKNDDFVLSGRGLGVLFLLEAQWESGKATAEMRIDNGILFDGSIQNDTVTLPVSLKIRENEIDFTFGDAENTENASIFRLKKADAAEAESKTLTAYALYQTQYQKTELSGEFVLSGGEISFTGKTALERRIGSDPVRYAAYASEDIAMTIHREGLLLDHRRIERGYTYAQTTVSVKKLSENRYLVDAQRELFSPSQSIRLYGILDTLGGVGFNGRVRITDRYASVYANLALSVKNNEFAAEIALKDAENEYLTLCAEGVVQENTLTGSAECRCLVFGNAQAEQTGETAAQAEKYTITLQTDFALDFAEKTLSASLLTDADGLDLALPEALEAKLSDRDGTLEIAVSANDQTAVFTLKRVWEAGKADIGSSLLLPNGNTPYDLTFRTDASAGTHEARLVIDGEALYVESAFDGETYALVLGADGQMRSLTASRTQEGNKTYLAVESDLAGAPVIFCAVDTAQENGGKDLYLTLSANGENIFALKVLCESVSEPFVHADGTLMTGEDVLGMLRALSEVF